MGDDRRYWNREELYEEVWSTPMRTLAQKYGISDVGLAKVCRKLRIPRPGRGYWARKNAGQAVKREALPPVDREISIPKPAPQEEKPHLDDLATVQERTQVEKLERSTGDLVLKQGSLSHPLILHARAVLGRATVDDRKIMRVHEQCLDIRVSKSSLDRALRIMAGLIGTIEAEGFSMAVGDGHREHTSANICGQQITFGLVEKMDRVDLVVAPKGGLLERVLTYGGKPVKFEPSGQLSIEVWRYWGRNPRRWRDGKSHRLEELLPQIVAGFVRIALAERAAQKKRVDAERERQRIAQELARLEKLIKLERSKVCALRHAAANWFRAEQVRSFVTTACESAKRNGQTVEPGTPFGDWVIWAEQQADRLDPLKESPSSIVDRENELEPDFPSYYGYQKPKPLLQFPKPIWRLK